jgi:hypothetical protein
MPEGVGYGPQNTASTGLELNIIGDHAYAFSGIKATSATPTNFLDFQTGAYYLVGFWQPTYLSDSTNNVRYDIQLNGLLVAGAEVNTSRDDTPFNKLIIIIPPFTHVEVVIDNLSGGTNNAGVVLTGRIYK